MKHCNPMIAIICSAGLTLTGCGVSNVKDIDPYGYVMASDYAFDVVEKSGCIGKVDGLFVKSGEKKVTKDGLEYVFGGNNLHCAQDSFKKQMADYCRNKGGEPVQGETWCRKDDTPIFYVGYLSTLEKNTNQSQEQWFNSALKRGFISERVQKEEALVVKENEEFTAKEKLRIKNMSLKANVGDSICREDYDVLPYQYPSKVYYQGYVESKSGSKLQVRIVRHGGDGFIINDTTPNPIIWIESKGWFHCK